MSNHLIARNSLNPSAQKPGLPFVEMDPARSRVGVEADPTIVMGVLQPHHFSTYRHHAVWVLLSDMPPL